MRINIVLYRLLNLALRGSLKNNNPFNISELRDKRLLDSEYDYKSLR
jgi:hypothetical protein